MNILVAQHAGFCWGVRQAMDTVLEASARWGGQGPVRTLGPIIHNPQALAQVALRGVGQSDSAADATGGTIIIRAHGIPVHELRDLQEKHRRKELRLINGTCPEVAKVQARIKRYASRGYFTVLLGTHGHAEAVAHESYASSGFSLVSNLQDAMGLTFGARQKVLVIAQTTFLVPDFEEIATHLRSRIPDCVVLNTICKDTWTRQREAETLCQRVDHVVVIGGKASNNTRHLADLAREAGKPFQWVESPMDLNWELLRDASEVGVLAGASTPTWIVDEVVETLEQAGNPSWNRLILRAIHTLQLPVALGTGVLAAVVQFILGWPSGWAGPLLPTTFHVAACALLPYLDPRGLELKGQIQGRFLAHHQWIFKALGAIAGAIALMAAAHQGAMALVGTLTLAALAAGYVRFGSNSRVAALRRIPAFKDLCQAWVPVMLAVVLPWGQGRATDLKDLGLAIVIIFGAALATHALRHLKAFREDHIVGREVLAAVIGSRATKWVAAVLMLGAMGSLYWIA